MKFGVQVLTAVGILLCSLLQEYHWSLNLNRLALTCYYLSKNCSSHPTLLLCTILGASGFHVSMLDIALASLVLLLTPIPTTCDPLEAFAHAIWKFFLPTAVNRISSGQTEVKFLLLAGVSIASVCIWVLTKAITNKTETLKYAREEMSGIRRDIFRTLRRNSASFSSSRGEISIKQSLETPVLVKKLKGLWASSKTPTLSKKSSTLVTRRGSAESDRFLPRSIDLSTCKIQEEELSVFPCTESSITSQSGSNDLSQDEIDCLINAIMRQEYVLSTQKMKTESLESESELIQVLLQLTTKTTRASQSMFNPMAKATIPLRTLMEENEELADEMSHLGEWDFNTLNLCRCTKEPLKEVSYYLFSTHSIPEKFSMSRSCLVKFLRGVEHKYHKENFYHNSLHATDVLNSVVFLLSSGLHRCGHFLDIEIFGLLVAAIGHDVNHPGVNNTFLINSSDPLALVFNDQSVLEMMHASTIFFILNRRECDVLAGVSPADVCAFRKVVIALILATDLQKHFYIQAEYRYQLEEKGCTLDDEEFRLRTLEICIKCADLGHSAKETFIHKQWTELIVSEFFTQGDKEQALGLPMSPLCDRSSVLIPKSQIGFLTVMVKPLFQLWDGLLRKSGDWEKEMIDLPFSICCQHIIENEEYWERESKSEEDSGQVYHFPTSKPPLLVEFGLVVSPRR